MNQKQFIMIAIFLTLILIVVDANARDLVDAAVAAQSAFTKIGIAAISIGFTIGGILFAIGAAQIGRMVLLSGFIGAVAILAAPAIINLLGRVFGVGL